MKETDEVYVCYNSAHNSSVSVRLTISSFHKLVRDISHYHFSDCRNGESQALDNRIMMLMSIKVCGHKYSSTKAKYVIVSDDKGYDKEVKKLFGDSIDYLRLGYRDLARMKLKKSKTKFFTELDKSLYKIDEKRFLLEMSEVRHREV